MQQSHYEVEGPHGDKFRPRANRYWGLSRDSFEELKKDDRIWWGKTGRTFPFRKRFENELGGLTPTTVWEHEEVGNNREAKQEITKIFGRDEQFATPKPERLLERILHIATNPGDLVLDSFLGSGTTAAVAQKMGRRWIGIEMGDHAVSHCVPRMQKVIAGEQGGISKAQGWQGGGGFRFYRLGPPVFAEDGQIQPDIRFPTLAAHIWFAETGSPWTAPQEQPSPFLGQHDGRGLALLYNGILGDKSVSGGNVLTRKTLATIRAAAGGFRQPLTIYGERTALTEPTLKAEGIEFRQTPYDVKARK